MTSTVITMTRQCAKCGLEKPTSEFWRDSGRGAIARGCINARCRTCADGYRTRYTVLPDDHPEIVNGRRVCRECAVEKSLCEFPKQTTGKSGRDYRCKGCFNEYRRAKSAENPRRARIADTPRDYARMFRFGLSAQTFKAIFDAQDGKCGICKSELDFLGKETCVDHDHATDLIRGILCGLCNRGLGHMRDDTEILRAAADYLEKHAASVASEVA